MSDNIYKRKQERKSILEREGKYMTNWLIRKMKEYRERWVITVIYTNKGRKKKWKGKKESLKEGMIEWRKKITQKKTTNNERIKTETMKV